MIRLRRIIAGSVNRTPTGPHRKQSHRLTPEEYVRPVESSVGGPRGGIQQGKHSTGQARD